MSSPQETPSDTALCKAVDSVPASPLLPPLRTLSPVEMHAVSLLVEGHSAAHISRTTGISAPKMKQLFNSAEVKEILSACSDLWKAEITSLIPQSIDVIRKGLRSGVAGERIRCADLLNKMTGQYAPEQVQTDTAETIIARILQVRNGDTTSISIEKHSQPSLPTQKQGELVDHA